MIVRTEVLKSLNKFLGHISLDERRIIYDKNGQEFESLVDCLYNCGDYDMQATIIETLLRFTTKTVRHKMVSAWFPNYVKLQSLFLGIKDFESDCRNFLTHFNEGLSDKKLVWSFPMMADPWSNPRTWPSSGSTSTWELEQSRFITLSR